jgi:hypothetical protein
MSPGQLTEDARMDYLKLPTDNLYKFVAFAGLASLVASLLYAPYFIQMTTRETNRLGEPVRKPIRRDG